jgi:MFS family permease
VSAIAMTNPVRARNALLFLVFADLTGFGMLIPDFQLRAEHLGAHGWMIGGMLSVMFVVQAVVSPAWGGLGDRVGQKPVILGCTALSALAMLVYSQATNIPVMVASRLLAGLGAANVAASQAYLAGVTSPDNRATVLGYLGAATSAGLIIGPALGGVLAHWGGALAVGGVAAACSLTGILAVALLVPNFRPVPMVDEKKTGVLQVLKENPVLAWLFGVSAVAWFSLACLEGTFGRLLEVTQGQGQLAFGLIFGYESVISVAAQSWAVKPLNAKFGARGLLLSALLLQGAGLAAMPFSPSMFWLVLAATVYSLGGALAGPSLNAWCSRLTPENRQGAVFGLLQSARSIGFIVGPTLGGTMFDRNPASPYLLAGVASAVAAILLAVISRKAAY